MSDKKTILIRIIIVFLMVSGLSLIAYPIFTDIPVNLNKSDTISSWEETQAASASSILETEASSQTTQQDFENEDNGSQATVENTATTQVNEKLTAEDIFPARLTIPKIEVDWITLEGADIPTLKKGPGHIPETPLPGEEGRFTLSGHRTTYGAPFNRIDELIPGDLIYLEALNGNFYAYKVTQFQIVKPTYVEILIGTEKKELLLTTCYPEYSARERLIIIAELVNIFDFDINLSF